MYQIDFCTPNWLITYYHLIGLISIGFDVISIYLIVFESSKIDNFRFFLLNFQIACSCTDIHLTFLFQPIPLYPLFSGFAMGALSTYFRATLHVCMCGIIFLMIYQIGTMIICFVKKHQTIALTLGKYSLSIHQLSFLMSFFIFYTFTVTGIFYFLNVPEDKKFEFVQKNYPELLDSFRSLPNFSIYEANTFFLILVTFAISGGVLAFLTFSTILFNIFRMLSELKSQLSTSTYHKHRVAIYSLIAQFATSSVCFLPPICFVFVVLMGVANSQVIVEVLVMIACLHSPLNVIVLMVTFPPYRRFAIQTVFGRRGTVSTKPSVIITHVS